MSNVSRKRKAKEEVDEKPVVDNASTEEKSTIPKEVITKLQKLNDSLTKLENSLAPHFNVPFEEHLERDPLDIARVDLMSLFVINSLTWSLMSVRGMDPRKNESLCNEVERTKLYTRRLNIIEERRKQRGLNKRVAKAFVRNALYELPEGAQKPDQETNQE